MTIALIVAVVTVLSLLVVCVRSRRKPPEPAPLESGSPREAIRAKVERHTR